MLKIECSKLKYNEKLEYLCNHKKSQKIGMYGKAIIVLNTDVTLND